MTTQAIALSSLLSLTVMAFFFFQLYPAFLLDSFRQRIFAIRRSLFEDAAEGEISFDKEAYQILRMTMNSVIRFAHEMSLFNYWLFIRKVEKQERDDPKDDFLLQGLEGLTAEEKKLIRSYEEDLKAEVLQYMILRSPFFSLFLVMKLTLGSYLNPDFKKTGETKKGLKEYNKKAISIVYSRDISERQSLYPKANLLFSHKAA